MLRKGLFAAGLLLAATLAGGLVGCGPSAPPPPNMTDITGIMPPLVLSMQRAEDGKQVTAKTYRGKVSVLYFGYTHCPDVCPMTLSNLSAALETLGDAAKDVRVLFVTVDPARDTLPVMKDYATAFAPQVEGLRGTDNQIAGLARRYRVAHSATPATDTAPYEVTHSNSVFFFDGEGRARYVTMQTGDPAALVKALQYLVHSARP